MATKNETVNKSIEKVKVVEKHTYEITSLISGKNYALYYDEEDNDVILSDKDGTEIYIGQEILSTLIDCLCKMKV